MKLMHVPVLIVVFLLLTIIPTSVFAEPAVYEPVSIEAVSGNSVNELGGIFAKFTAGRLHKNDFVIFRLPEGFIWTTADVKSNISSASRWIQSTEQWNSITYDTDGIRYGTKNYVLVPGKYAGKENGLFQNSTSVLSFTSLNEREVKMEVIAEPKPGQDCCFYLYPKRIFVASGYEGNIGITIDAFDDSGFAYNDNLYVSVECTGVRSVYAGLGGQRIGTIKITEDTARQFINDTSITFQLPLGARWEKLCDAENNGLKVTGVISNDGRTAEFKFAGASKAAVDLQLKDMEVYIAPDMTGDLIVEIGGTAGFAGKLQVADLIRPGVAFIIGKDHFIQNGTEYKMDTAPYIKRGITYLPVRYIARALDIPDHDILWNPSDRSVVIIKGTRFIKFVVNSNIMYINGSSVSMDAKPEVVEPGRTMVPLHWVAQAFGANIIWNEENETIIIN
ncbi:MAG: copper amine oxidase N-terminal domain-containing protein [Desulfotomaculaceae bacterium]|nr:copper amine oxidase N-terminal domain-containing protein [Desulfotomaculaceae bacterium]